MKTFEVKALGLEELNLNETKQTDGGSLIALAVIAAVALIATGCTCTVVVGDNNQVGDSSEKGSGTDVETSVSVLK